ncbi:MAG: hypothetical protein L0211_18665, partial [Planctomycetaceae bacterium]|nr:hypothetical protein [Planctomycetaceae bacterium]
MFDQADHQQSKWQNLDAADFADDADQPSSLCILQFLLCNLQWMAVPIANCETGIAKCKLSARP